MVQSNWHWKPKQNMYCYIKRVGSTWQKPVLTQAISAIDMGNIGKYDEQPIDISYF